MNSVGVGTYAQNIAISARNGLGGVGTYNTGWNFTVGFVNGMNAVNLYDYAWNLASRAVSAVKGCLGIASPSKVAEEMGRYFGEGAVIGMQATEGDIAAEAERMSGMMGLDPNGYQGGAYGLQAQRRGSNIPSAVTMNVTVNVNAKDAAQARAVGTGIADGLYEEVSRKMGGELWPASYSAA